MQLQEIKIEMLFEFLAGIFGRDIIGPKSAILGSH